MPLVLQKASFYSLKGNLLRRERPPLHFFQAVRLCL